MNNGKLVNANIFVQIIPSLMSGLKYVVFLKNYDAKRKIFCLTNNQIVYSSDSFQKYHEDHQYIFIEFLQKNPF